MFTFGNLIKIFFLLQPSPTPTIKMSTNLTQLSIKDLELLLRIQWEKLVKEAEAKWVAEEEAAKKGRGGGQNQGQGQSKEGRCGQEAEGHGGGQE